jgi:AraC-like DNA-binding protein
MSNRSVARKAGDEKSGQRGRSPVVRKAVRHPTSKRRPVLTAAEPATAPEAPSAMTRPFDLLTDVMDQVRLEGTMYFRTVCNGAYGIRIERKARTPFYAIQEGEAEIRLLDRDEVHHASAGDLILLPNAAAHIIGSGAENQVLDLHDWMALHPMDAQGTVYALRGNGPITRVTGGFFDIDTLRIHPLMHALPPVIHLKGTDAAVQRWLAPTLEFIHAELDAGMQGAQTVLRRMADVLFIQAVRAYALQHGCAASWLRGLSDRRIGQALTLLHSRYAEPWTVDSLAREVGMSRTLLAVQFKDLVGESPISYLTRWRITRAANRLRSERVSLERVAESVGYTSDAVFSKAFRQITGIAPGRYRREQATVTAA